MTPIQTPEQERGKWEAVPVAATREWIVRRRLFNGDAMYESMRDSKGHLLTFASNKAALAAINQAEGKA